MENYPTSYGNGYNNWGGPLAGGVIGYVLGMANNGNGIFGGNGNTASEGATVSKLNDIQGQQKFDFLVGQNHSAELQNAAARAESGFQIAQLQNQMNAEMCSVRQAIADCCCATQKLMLEDKINTQASVICDLKDALSNERQTSSIRNYMDAQTAAIVAAIKESKSSTTPTTAA